MKTCVLHPERKAITTAAHIPVCEECNTDFLIENSQHQRFEDRTFFRRLLEAVPERSLALQEVVWRMQYAPHGFIFSTYALDFLQISEQPNIVAWTTQYLHDSLRQKLRKVGLVPGYDEARAFTRITVYPKQVGEDLNHLDKLQLRMGIEIEIRWPVDSAAELQACAMNG